MIDMLKSIPRGRDDDYQTKIRRDTRGKVVIAIGVER